MRTLLLALLVGALSFFLVGCEADALRAEEEVLLGLEIEGRIGEAPLAGSPMILTQNGLNLHLNTARLYVSNLVLEREDGTEVIVRAAAPITLPARAEDGSDVVHTAEEFVHWARLDRGAETVSVNEVPAGRYRAFRYDVGVRGMTNRVDATQAPAGHPLAKQTDVNNHWSWTTGYMFIRLDGRLDLNGDGQPDQGDAALVALHVGFDSNLRTVRHEQPFTISPGQRHLRLAVDFAKLTAAVDLSNPSERRWNRNPAIAPAVADRTQEAFRFLGVR